MKSYVWSAGFGMKADETLFLYARSVTSSQLVKVRRGQVTYVMNKN